MRQSVRFGDQIAATVRGRFELLLPDDAAPCPQQAVGRLVSHRKHAGRRELQVGMQVQQNLSARCQLVLVGRLRPPRGHDGQRGRRSKRKRLSNHEKQPYCTPARPGRLAGAGFSVGENKSLAPLGNDQEIANRVLPFDRGIRDSSRKTGRLTTTHSRSAVLLSCSGCL